MNNCIDITDDELKNKNNNSREPRYVCEYIKVKEDGTIIKYDESNAKFDKKKPKSDELRTINNLFLKLSWEIDILCRINENGVSTPDIRRICNKLEYWDIKNIYGSKSDNSKKSKLKHRISKQCNNFVLDITNDECDLTNDEAIKQIIDIYSDSRYKHVDKIVLFGKNDLIKVFKRK